MIRPLARKLAAVLGLRLTAPEPTSHEAIFADVYRRRVWGSDETVSGLGSTRARAEAFTPELVDLLRRLDARVVLDAACGDFNWMSEVANHIDHYIGVDVVPELVSEVAARHARAGKTFMVRDITRDPLPRADVIICRDVLVHFSLLDATGALRNFERSGSRYLLATTFLDTERNADISTGEWRELNMERSPFSFPPAIALIDEQCLHSDGRYRSKRLGLWALRRGAVQ